MRKKRLIIFIGGIILAAVSIGFLFIKKDKRLRSGVCPLIAPACPLENCLKAGKELEAKYRG